MPGEILDFLACAPQLKEDATVVLHDVTLNHASGAIYNYATKVLFDIMSADKYWMINKNTEGEEDAILSPESISNIAAFKLNGKSMDKIRDLFSSLSLTWNYYPGDEQLKTYRKLFKETYCAEYIEIFDFICDLQRSTYNDRIVVNNMGLDTIEAWRSESGVYIYGAGYWGEKYYRYARRYDLPVDGMVISDGNLYDSHWMEYGIPLYHLSEFIEQDVNEKIIIAIDKKNKGEIIYDLMKLGIKNILL